MANVKDFFPASDSKTWIDPATGDRYSYPADFVLAVWRNLGRGYANRLHADAPQAPLFGIRSAQAGVASFPMSANDSLANF